MAVTSSGRNRIRLTDDFGDSRFRRGPGGRVRRKRILESSGLALHAGDSVAVVAPGFAVRPRALRAGIAALRAMGFEVQVGEHVLSRHGYLAGTDAERAADLDRAARDRRVRAIWFARGGYGTARLLDRLDWRALEARPRLFIGYSDLTALYAPLLRRTSSICVYGPSVAELGDASAYHRPSLEAALRGQPSTLRFAPRQVLRAGRAEGRLLGGNLTVLCHSLGTPHAPDLRGSLLFLEDVGEDVYRIDRALRHLTSAGALAGLAGVALGNFRTPRSRRSFPPDRRLADVLEEYLVPLGIPVVRGLPAGHLPNKRSIPLGGSGALDTRAGTLVLHP